ncbi:MAG TPA: antibiotic biosynthesis monooxygenase [Trichormus sp.]|jgi:heme-degrading monooxygenase HmoA
MFSVLFEAHPKNGQWDQYLDFAKVLKPELEQIDGFVDNIRYKSLTREGWILSLSSWRDEKSVVRWRTQAMHHGVQEKGREQVFLDYHLRVGQITRDTKIPSGYQLQEQRLDETEVGEGTAVLLIDAVRPADVTNANTPIENANWLGLDTKAPGLASWDLYDAVLTPGTLILMSAWKDDLAADSFAKHVNLKKEARLRQVRVIRDYTMFDRREAPQYYPDQHKTAET